MMNRTKTKKTGLIKYLLILPVAFALMLLNTAATASPAIYLNVENYEAIDEIAIMQNDDPIFEVVEQQPLFPGGPTAMMQWLSENLNYPEEVAEQGIQGRVVVSFVVEKDGSITNAQVVRGIDPLLDREAVRVVQAMPNWQPGKQGGEVVRVRFNVPITFRLSRDGRTETVPPPSSSEDPIFEAVEQQPEFQGGPAAMMQWLNESMRYPTEALQQGIQGRVTVGFVVEKDGSLTDVRILRGVDPLLDAESVRVVQLMPNWQPGRQGGEVVRVRYNLPLTFRLQ
jgi:TonB family protein